MYAFSAFLGEQYNLPSNMLCNHIFGTVSSALSSNNASCTDMDAFYQEDAQSYDNMAAESECISHPTITQVSIKTEDYARKILGIILSAEDNITVRKRVIDILKLHYPHVYKTIKKHNLKYLTGKYSSISCFLNSEDAKYDRSIFFYLSFYCSPDWVDQKMLNSIAESIFQYENYSPLQADINLELLQESKAIGTIRNEIEDKFGAFGNYLNVIEHSDNSISFMGNVIENLFHINKLNMDDIYYNYKQLPMDEIYLALVKQSQKINHSKVNIFALISCIYIQPLLQEYKFAKEYIRANRPALLIHDLATAKTSNEQLKSEKQLLLAENRNLLDQKHQFSELLSQTKAQIQKDYDTEIIELNRTIKDLKLQLQRESTYRQELNMLREFIFKLDLPISSPEGETLRLTKLISCKNIVIIGGARPWRQKLREAFPMINSLNGNNSSLDLSLIKNIDCVLFYTSHMSHAVYNKAMNYIRSNHIKFAYIKATNIQLLEVELIDVLKQCDVIR